MTLDTGRWTLNSRLWMLDFGRWALDGRRRTLVAELSNLDATLWTLGSGHRILSLFVSEQNHNPVSDSAWINYWKFFGCESLWRRHGHACSVETIGSDVTIFRNSILTLVLLYKRIPKEISSISSNFHQSNKPKNKIKSI